MCAQCWVCLFFFCGVAGRGDAKTHQISSTKTTKPIEKITRSTLFGPFWAPLGVLGAWMRRWDVEGSLGSLWDPSGALWESFASFLCSCWLKNFRSYMRLYLNF